MNAWRQWVQRPQNLWVRRSLFQVHLWIGIGIGIYVLLISLSGSAIVYRRELTKEFAKKPIKLLVSSPKLIPQELREDVERQYPEYTLDDVYQQRRPGLPVEVVLERQGKRLERLFDPYTGTDLGDPVSNPERVVEWLVDFHDNLLAGLTGRFINGVGSILVTVLALTGTFIWWPGLKTWRRSTTVDWKANFARLNWDLHSALGFWCSLLILIWGVSGIYFTFPDPFNFFLSDNSTRWLGRLHFGRFNRFAEVLWTVLGLVPAALFVTGALMWWNRVLRKGRRQSP